MKQFHEWFSNNSDMINQWAFESLLVCATLIVMVLTQLFFLKKLRTVTKMSDRRKSAIFLLIINLPVVVIGLFIQFFSVIGFVYIIFILLFDVMIIDAIKNHELF